MRWIRWGGMLTGILLMVAAAAFYPPAPRETARLAGNTVSIAHPIPHQKGAPRRRAARARSTRVRRSMVIHQTSLRGLPLPPQRPLSPQHPIPLQHPVRKHATARGPKPGPSLGPRPTRGPKPRPGPGPGIIVRPTPPRRVAPVTRFLPTRHRPWYVRIPSIGVNARLIMLGYPKSDRLPVPSLSEAFHVGWYRFSSVPGQQGNTVLVGHVDTYQGPAVFYNLYQLRPGDHIYFRLGAHGYARYTVRSVDEVSKTSLPANQIFGDTHAKRLWLITCGGPFDYLTHHYLDNIIVSASR